VLEAGRRSPRFGSGCCAVSGDEGVLFGVEFFNFEALYHRCWIAPGTRSARLGRQRSRQVLRRVTEQLYDEGGLELLAPSRARLASWRSLRGQVGELKRRLSGQSSTARPPANLAQ